MVSSYHSILAQGIKFTEFANLFCILSLKICPKNYIGKKTFLRQAERGPHKINRTGGEINLFQLHQKSALVSCESFQTASLPLIINILESWSQCTPITGKLHWSFFWYFFLFTRQALLCSPLRGILFQLWKLVNIRLSLFCDLIMTACSNYQR